MRHVLIDYPRAQRAEKRGGGATREPLDESAFPFLRGEDEGFRIASEALQELAREHERTALVVSLKVFGGLTIPESAEEVKFAAQTVKNHWTRARDRRPKLRSQD